MVQTSAKKKYIRIAPRKMALIADLIRGKKVNVAISALQFSKRQRSAGIVSNILKSAVANADQRGTIDVDALVVKTVLVGPGPTLKRFMTRAKGSASAIKKRTCHVQIILAEGS